MNEFREDGVEISELIVLIGFPRVFINEDDGLWFVSNEAEVIEVLKMHNFEIHILY